ncbi:LUD domain-containing protein [Bizionia paragorgiae]|uniref:Uncharacterized ACR, YkgG family COG1556 n=2 Tax=Bizionia paragorgiae TaxID=283786 RepID=A0A1H3Z9U4_BIZPA|nr:LUD domain-containing protein [Bizionia paragorgiae]SEA20131.1 Uncharacterised ACR, YkgG family COG1556 [Bizionia paragorgiae]
MSLFRKLFGSKSDKEKEEETTSQGGKYMPPVKLPIDESFMINFKDNGGKFLYCDTMNEVYDNMALIIEENNWQDKSAYFYDQNLKQSFNDLYLNTSGLSDATYFVSTCENLISDDGSILLSSNQLAEKKLSEFPTNIIIFATTSQIVTNIGEGLREIKTKNANKIPTNISTIKLFKPAAENDFLTYGSPSKNLYLLLLEDL